MLTKDDFRNKVIQGDCLVEMRNIPDKSIDMILCDLPYGTTRNKWDSIIPLDELWEQYERIIKDNGAIVLTAQTPFDKVLGTFNLKLLRYEWIWEKSKATGHLNAKRMPLKNHENILVFYKKLPTYNPQGLVKKKEPTIRRGGNGNGTNYGKSNKDSLQEYENYPKAVLKFPSEYGLHPTQKPVELFEYLIKTYTNKGDLVLDNTAGSGTTGVACLNTGRDYCLMEMEQEYVDVINKRLSLVNDKEEL